MNLRFLSAMCLFGVTSLGCGDFDSSFQESEETVDEETTGSFETSPPQNQKPDYQAPTEDHGEGTGPCPVDTYLILEKDGVKYTVKIQVFCDPIQNIINLGCPAPY